MYRPCDVPVSKQVSLFQGKTRLSYGARAAGVRYPSLESKLWCQVPEPQEVLKRRWPNLSNPHLSEFISAN
ncbi:hypothetical protein TNCV_2607201 [Trichonephila clavipes]|uniref:Uncharacterized protein n=1 Tax=Trichonephila clavipes TaxID=2585209 RepID=A0A8X6S3X0_TRICX|nr:hypothetical protein TNCV_2607201 [Trichonephila clavipes]